MVLPSPRTNVELAPTIHTVLRGLHASNPQINFQITAKSQPPQRNVNSKFGPNAQLLSPAAHSHTLRAVPFPTLAFTSQCVMLLTAYRTRRTSGHCLEHFTAVTFLLLYLLVMMMMIMIIILTHSMVQSPS